MWEHTEWRTSLEISILVTKLRESQNRGSDGQVRGKWRRAAKGQKSQELWGKICTYGLKWTRGNIES